MYRGLFWVALFMLWYTYLGYPNLLFVISLFRHKIVNKGDITPMVSMIITVYNEEKVIRDKLENVLILDYPKDKLEIIVVSDGSTDSTNQITESYAEKGVRLIVCEQRQGKHYAQGAGVREAQGDILAFTDAAPLLKKDALLNLVRNFADSTVGGVTSEDRVLNEDNSGNKEGTYIGYEMTLRRLESRIGSVVGMSGSFFAVRKELCHPWDPDYSTDFLLALRSVKRELRVVHDRSSLHFYGVVPSSGEEFNRKVRTIINGLRVLFSNSDILNPLRFGFFSFEVLSHKLLRWLVPIFLFLLFATNLTLIHGGWFYQAFFLAQLFFYLGACLFFVFPGLNHSRILKIPAFFCLANGAVLVAWFKFLLGKNHQIWEPSQR